MSWGHVSYWPGYRRTTAPERTYAILSNGRLVTEHGELLPADSYELLTAALFDHNLIALVRNLPAQAWLTDAAADEHAQVLVNETTGQLTVRIRRGRAVRWLVPAEAWSLPPGNEGLSTIRAWSRHLGIGDYPTPSGYGQASMRALYPETERAVSRPPLPVVRRLQRHMVGGRVDTLTPPEVGHARVWEWDINSAYAAAAMRLPAGTATRFRGALPSTAACGFQEARVYFSDSGMMPLPVRAADGAVAYPERGDVSGVWWTEELDAAEAAGAAVYRGWGDYWPQWNEALGEWARCMLALRQTAPAEDVAAIAKLCTVAGLGRFGSSGESTQLTTRPVAGDEPFLHPRLGYDSAFWLHREWGDREGALPHWYSHIQATVRLWLWQRAQRDTGLIATNYDAIYTTTPPAPAEASSAELGGWKWKMLSNVTIPAARHIVSDEKVRRPGVPRARTA